jgi:hypothetical protein
MLLPDNAERQPRYSLTQEELNDPYLVFDELFDFAKLPDARALLWEWLKVTVTGTYHKNLPATDRADIITMYEKMERLLEAAHILHLRKQETATPKRKRKKKRS